jgi:hypothetical protein
VSLAVKMAFAVGGCVLVFIAALGVLALSVRIILNAMRPIDSAFLGRMTRICGGFLLLIASVVVGFFAGNQLLLLFVWGK